LKRPFTVAFVDLDHFKEVNDTLGHAEGDRVLQAVAATITQHLRATDVVARLGGDEFGILMADCGPAQARTSLERLEPPRLSACPTAACIAAWNPCWDSTTHAAEGG